MTALACIIQQGMTSLHCTGHADCRRVGGGRRWREDGRRWRDKQRCSYSPSSTPCSWEGGWEEVERKDKNALTLLTQLRNGAHRGGDGRGRREKAKGLFNRLSHKLASHPK